MAPNSPLETAQETDKGLTQAEVRAMLSKLGDGTHGPRLAHSWSDDLIRRLIAGLDSLDAEIERLQLANENLLRARNDVRVPIPSDDLVL